MANHLVQFLFFENPSDLGVLWLLPGVTYSWRIIINLYAKKNSKHRELKNSRILDD